MQLGGLAGLTALTMGLGQEGASGGKTSELKRQDGPETQQPAIALESVANRQ
jgi:hypothetical protein